MPVSEVRRYSFGTFDENGMADRVPGVTATTQGGLVRYVDHTIEGEDAAELDIFCQDCDDYMTLKGWTYVESDPGSAAPSAACSGNVSAVDATLTGDLTAVDATLSGNFMQTAGWRSLGNGGGSCTDYVQKSNAGSYSCAYITDSGEGLNAHWYDTWATDKHRYLNRRDDEGNHVDYPWWCNWSTGESTFTIVKVSDVLKLVPQGSAPTGAKGYLYTGTDGKLYHHNGTAWKEMAVV